MFTFVKRIEPVDMDFIYNFLGCVFDSGVFAMKGIPTKPTLNSNLANTRFTITFSQPSNPFEIA